MNESSSVQNDDKDSSSKDKKVEGAPVAPIPMIRAKTLVDSTPIAVIEPPATIDEELLAISRRKIFDEFVSGKISRKQAIEKLAIKRSRFYELIKAYRESSDYRGMVRQKRGPLTGSTHTTPEMLEIFECAYLKRFKGLRAGVASVLGYASRLCEKKGLPRPTRYAVSKFLNTKPEREKYYLRYGKEKGDQKYQQRDDFVEFDSPLQSIVMDHTMVDVLLVDSVFRDVIVGRPWLTIIICAMTRVILGYYLSLTHPNVITVQLAIVAAILPKNSAFNPVKDNPEVYPFCGVPKQIYTDNAAEFISQQLIAKCARYGIDWDHRPIGKKWYGGIVERVIGTFMQGVHFLPGATGSNVLERESFECELNACMDIQECRAWFGNKVTEYHGKIHSALKCSPRAAWTHALALGRADLVSNIEDHSEKSFILDFMPSSYDHKIHSYGINFAGRRYSDDALELHIGGACELRYNPYNLASVWVVLDGYFHEIPCARIRAGLSNDWEVYTRSLWISRASADHKNMPNGTVTDEYAYEAMDRQDAIEMAAIEKSLQYKKAKKITGDASHDGAPWIAPETVQGNRDLPDSQDHFPDDDLDDYKPTILIDKLID